MKGLVAGKVFLYLLTIAFSFIMVTMGAGAREDENEPAERFYWWPTDAAPAPVRDQERGGYWWWPTIPGEVSPWGNRGYIYVRRIIFDYEAEEILLIKRISKNVKIFFDFDKAKLRDEARPILENAVKLLHRRPEDDILIMGNTDVRGPKAHNLALGRRRAEAVQGFMLGRGISEGRIRILSRGELDAIAPVDDLVGLQKDRNAHFIIAEVQEIMVPRPPGVICEVKVVEEVREIKAPVRVDTREYTVRKGDTLWSIAVREYGDGNQWRRIYSFNRDRIPNPHKLKPGLTIIIPIE